MIIVCALEAPPLPTSNCEGDFDGDGNGERKGQGKEVPVR